MEKLKYRNEIPVAAHRGIAKFYPENTLVSFAAAKALHPDMVENDLHMTRDGEIIVMHDHKVDRTTDGTGLIREKTLAEIKALDAGSWKGEEFRGERVPTFREFLELFKDDKDILFNIELKDYPVESGEFAIRSAEKSIAMMDEYGITERSVINTWSGELNEYLVEHYGDRLRIHAYYPQEWMNGHQKRYVFDYAYCVCLFGSSEHPVVGENLFKLAKNYGAEPWVFFGKDTEEILQKAVDRGAELITSNDPAFVIDFLRKIGKHS